MFSYRKSYNRDPKVCVCKQPSAPTSQGDTIRD